MRQIRAFLLKRDSAAAARAARTEQRKRSRQDDEESSAVLGFFDIDRKDYRRIPISEQVEILSLIGDVAVSEGKPRVHAHVVIGKADGTALGGHLLEGRARPTLELVLVPTPARLVREHDPRFGIPLIRLGEKKAA